jgi:hypothetical protein
MTPARKTTIVSILLVGSVLVGYLSPAAAAALLCIGEGTAEDCCRRSEAVPTSRPADGARALAGEGCDCCITVDALPSLVGASPSKAPPDLMDAAAFSNVVLPSSTRVPRAMGGERDDLRLSTLRTIVLLI